MRKSIRNTLYVIAGIAGFALLTTYNPVHAPGTKDAFPKDTLEQKIEVPDSVRTLDERHVIVYTKGKIDTMSNAEYLLRIQTSKAVPPEYK